MTVKEFVIKNAEPGKNTVMLGNSVFQYGLEYDENENCIYAIGLEFEKLKRFGPATSAVDALSYLIDHAKSEWSDIAKGALQDDIKSLLNIKN